MADVARFYAAKPFRHLTLTDFANRENVRGAFATVPSPYWNHWVNYDNEVEAHKQTCNDLVRMPRHAMLLLNWLLSEETTQRLRTITGIADLVPDETLHGAGLHIMRPGAWLQVHGDYELHPHKQGYERRLNLILFLNPVWEETWGGALLLCDGWGKAVQRHYPQENMAVIFECGSASFHGVQENKSGAARATLAAYYLAPARATAHRHRAMFLPNRNQGQCPEEVR